MKRLLFPIVLLLSLMLMVSCALPQDPGTDVDPTPRPGNGDPNGDVKGDPDGNGHDVLTAADLFPMEANVRMVYRGEGMEYASFETYVEFLKDKVIQKRNINPGTTMAHVYVVEEGSVLRVFTAEEVYHRYDYTDKRETEAIILMDPIAVGTAWTMADGVERSITAVDMKVEVPAGTYQAVEITTVGAEYTIRDYYAEGIGLIKTIFVSEGSEDYPIISELESIERDAVLKQTARIFYPDFFNERVVFTMEAFALSTNQEILEQLEEALKSVPEDSALTPPLTENTQLRSVELDSEAHLLTVDLSGHFLEELNAGAALESMILRSLVNTFGEYYGVERVVLTIEGSLYSSGHFELLEGDFFPVDMDDIEEY